MEILEESTEIKANNDENKRNIDLLVSYLESSSCDQALELVRDDNYKNWMSTSSWELIPIVTQYLTVEINKNNPRLIECCQEILNEIAQAAMPEETFLEILDKMDGEGNDVLLLSLLSPVDIILNRLPSKRIQSLQWCLTTLQDSLAFIDYDDDIRVLRIFGKIEEFYERYVEEVAWNKDSSTETSRVEVEREREVLACFLLGLLSLLAPCRPLAPPLSVVRCLARLLPSLPLDYFMRSRVFSEDFKHGEHFMDKVPDEAFQMLFYLVLHQEAALDSLPCVHSPVYIFICGLALSCGLLESEQEVLQERGLSLLTSVLYRVDPEEISHRALAFPHHPRLFKALSRIMVFSPSKSLRQTSTSLLQKYLVVFDPKGRYLVIKNAIIISEHSGITGYLVAQIKEFTLQYINDKNNYFIINLPQLLCFVCKLSKGNKTLLFEESDQIISTLNLIRFLALKDPKPGTLGFWEVESYIKTQFLQPLSQALPHSRDYLQGQLYDAKCLEAQETNKFDMANVSVGGQLLPVPKYEEEVRGVQAKVTTLDFISFLLDMVAEAWGA